MTACTRRACAAIAAGLVLALGWSGPVMAQGTGKPLRVQYVGSFEAADLRALLGRDAQRLFVARRSGQVDALDAEGRVVLTLPSRDDKGQALLQKPEAVAVSDKVIYVVDSDLHQVAMYTSDGQPLGRFAAKGSGPGQLDAPQGLTFHDGVVYVADTGNGRIQMFGDNGVFLGALAIEQAEANRQLKERKIAYRLDKPTAVAIDGSGRLMVLDAGSALFSDESSIKIYDHDGAYLGQLPKHGRPGALFMGRGGLFVADREGYAVQRYGNADKLAGSFGSRGEGRGQFRSLSGLALRGDEVYVGDSERGVIHQFRAEAARRRATWTNEQPSVRWLGQVAADVAALAWDRRNNVLYAAVRDKPVLLRIRETEVQELALKDITATALAFDAQGGLWTLDRQRARVSKLDAEGQEVLGFGGSGSANAQFSDASDLAISSAGDIYVADAGNSRVQVFSSDGVFLKAMVKAGKGKLERPAAIALDAKDRLYVLDTSRKEVLAYASNGRLLQAFGRKPQDEAARFDRPVDLAVTGEEVLVLDADRIRVHAPNGALLRTFAASGKAAGELGEAVRLALRDDTDFFVAEHGNQRIQSMRIVYKPRAPQGVQVRADVHALALTWEASSQPFVTGYRVYRSNKENGGFVRVGISTEPQFTDAEREPGQTYYYQVTAATVHGQEGPTGEVVSAAALRYVPPPPQGIEPEATTSSINLRWKPVEHRFVTGYVVYRKEGEKFVSLAETTTAEFLREKLLPGTGYTVYLATRGVDGEESEKVAVQASTLVDNRAPLEIDAGDLHNVFSNSYKLYEQDGVGTVRLTNNTRQTLADIKVSFVLNNFMDFPTESRIDALPAGESKEVVLKAVFNNNILTLTEDSPVQAKIEAAYFEGGQPRTYSKIKTLNIYDKHRMSWDERNRYAAFITPKDPVVLNFSRAVAAEAGDNSKDPTRLAAAVFNTLGALGLTYVQDPTNPYQVTSNKIDYVDYIQYPRETIQRRTGDCDDLVALYAASLESLGISTRALLVPGHMLMMLATGVQAEADGYTMSDMYVIHEGVLWIPVEVTLVGKSFTKAWEAGAATYYRDRGHQDFSIFNLRDAWARFKPASLPDDVWKAPPVGLDAIERAFPGDLLSVLKISSQTLTRRYLKAIQDNPKDLDAHLQVGIILARQGDRNEARKYFQHIVQADAGHAAALNNLGNLHMLDGRYEEAQKRYAVAARRDPGDADILVNLARAYKAGKRMAQAKDAYTRARRIDPKVDERYKALGLELMNILTNDKAKGKRKANDGKRGKQG